MFKSFVMVVMFSKWCQDGDFPNNFARAPRSSKGLDKGHNYWSQRLYIILLFTVLEFLRGCKLAGEATFKNPRAGQGGREHLPHPRGASGWGLGKLIGDADKGMNTRRQSIKLFYFVARFAIHP